MKKVISFLIIASMLILSLLSFSSCGKLSGIKKSEKATNYVIIDVEDYGKILVELYPDVAPITVENFKTLVGKGFYDGLTFHRIKKGFMIQGGDPKGNGTGGNTDENGNEINIFGEFSSNGFENELKHERGVISMARANDPNSASSQFFIMHETTESLDGDYAAFGKVLYGMETVDKIASVQTNYKDRPLDKVVIKSVYFVNVDGTEFAK